MRSRTRSRQEGTLFPGSPATDKNYLGSEAKPLPIGPGYTATAEILTDKKTVLAYLMKPILKARDAALRNAEPAFGLARDDPT